MRPIQQQPKTILKKLERDWETSRILLITLCLTTFALIIASVLSDDWVESTMYYEKRGLWRYCNTSDCFFLSDSVVKSIFEGRPGAPSWLMKGAIPDWLNVCRALCIIAASFELIAFCVTIAGLFNKKILGYFTSILTAVTFLCMLTSVYLFEDKQSYAQYNLSCGKGWGLGFLSVVLSFLSSFVGFCIF